MYVCNFRHKSKFENQIAKQQDKDPNDPSHYHPVSKPSMQNVLSMCLNQHAVLVITQGYRMSNTNNTQKPAAVKEVAQKVFDEMPKSNEREKKTEKMRPWSQGTSGGAPPRE